MRKGKKLLLPLILAGIIAVQAVAIPGRLGRFVGMRNDDFDIDDYDSTFTGWTVDSLWVLGDSLLRFDANDSIPEDSLILLDFPDDSLAAVIDSFVHCAYIADSTQRARIAWQKHNNHSAKHRIQNKSQPFAFQQIAHTCI